MAAAPQRSEFIAIVGPTASGKSDLALRIAKKFNGEIICADSRTVYKDMDIGTAKPSTEEQKEVPHWGLDLAAAGERFTVHEFKMYANEKIKDIQRRGRLPILVGGTGLYIDAVVFDFELITEADLEERSKLETKTVAELQKLINAGGLQMPENQKNKRHLVRTIETGGKTAQKRSKPLKGTLITGISPSDKVLKTRINRRAEVIFESGVVEETEKLLDKYGEDALLSTGGIVYKICLQFIKGEIDIQKAKELFKTADWQYARRQRTWFKRNKFIHWFPNTDVAYSHIAKTLNKEVT